MLPRDRRVTGPSFHQAVIAAAAGSSKKAHDVVVLDVGDIASASNTRQVKTIVEEVEYALKQQHSRSPKSVEGLDDASWVLLDFGDFIVHVFLDETRAYYELERLWSDAPRVDWEQLAAVVSGAP